MNRLEHLLVIFAEECSEVAQETSKALRFGIDEKRDFPTSNRERISYEFSQLLAVKAMLEAEGVHIPIDLGVMNEKQKKVEKYLIYSKKCGTLTDKGDERKAEKSRKVLNLLKKMWNFD